MSDFDSWDIEQYTEGIDIFEKDHKDDKIENIEALSSLLADLMVKHGPDGHCDGHDQMALIIWRILKDEPQAIPECLEK